MGQQETNGTASSHTTNCGGGYKRVLKPNGAVLLFAQQPFASALGASNLKWLRYEWVWKKRNSTGFLNAKRCPLKSHENVLVFYKSLPTYNPQFIPCKPRKVSGSKGREVRTYDAFGATEAYVTDHRYPTDVLEFGRDEDAFHPTQKPLGLIKYLIKTYSNEGDIVLDNCMGSGTTAVACIQTNRHFIGFELNEEYFKKSLERIEKVKHGG